jgi:hypothetical protein
MIGKRTNIAKRIGNPKIITAKDPVPYRKTMGSCELESWSSLRITSLVFSGIHLTL